MKVLDLGDPPLFGETWLASLRKLWVDFHTGLRAFYGCKIFQPECSPLTILELNFRVIIIEWFLHRWSWFVLTCFRGEQMCTVVCLFCSNPDGFTTCVRPACFRSSVLLPIVELGPKSRKLLQKRRKFTNYLSPATVRPYSCFGSSTPCYWPSNV